MKTPENFFEERIKFYPVETAEERFIAVTNIIDEFRNEFLNQMKKVHPSWTKGTLMASYFRYMYKNEFSSQELKNIEESIMEFHDRKS